MPSILSRKRDLCYLIFFLLHLPILLVVDLYPLYPRAVIPAFMTALRTHYIQTYHDRFFTAPPAWFGLYIWMEALYHLPLCCWAIPALLQDDPRVPVALLIYAVQTVVTTATCIADFLSWEAFSATQKVELAKLYVPYLAVSVFMAVDMWARLSAALTRAPTTDRTRKLK